MPKSGTYGSVRGVPGNRHPYRDRGGSVFTRRQQINLRFHILFLDGVYVTTGDRLIFRRVPPPTAAALEALVRVNSVSERVGRTLERQGLLVRDLGV